jgi:hypothetical protein
MQLCLEREVESLSPQLRRFSAEYDEKSCHSWGPPCEGPVESRARNRTLAGIMLVPAGDFSTAVPPAGRGSRLDRHTAAEVVFQYTAYLSPNSL